MAKQKVNVRTITDDKIVSIEIHSDFYKRINIMIQDHCSGISKSQMIAALAKIKHNEVGKDKFTFNFETLLILLQSIEESFEKAGYMVDNDMEFEFPEKSNDFDLNFTDQFNIKGDEDEEDDDEV